jgi:hypothetical protein
LLRKLLALAAQRLDLGLEGLFPRLERAQLIAVSPGHGRQA